MDKKTKTNIKAIDKLIEHYEKYKANDIPPSYQDIGNRGNCPLCKLHIISETGSCASCPWFYIDNIGCTTASYRYDNTVTRLLRLRRWKKKIIEEINHGS